MAFDKVFSRYESDEPKVEEKKEASGSWGTNTNEQVDEPKENPLATHCSKYPSAHQAECLDGNLQPGCMKDMNDCSCPWVDCVEEALKEKI